MLVIGDVHGELDLLINLLENVQDEDVYFVGDLIDRGDKCLESLLYVKEKGYKTVLGNHESMMLNYFQDKTILYELIWFSSGGRKTLGEYNLLSENQQQEIISYLEGLPLYYYLENIDVLISHAGVNINRLKLKFSLNKLYKKWIVNEKLKIQELLKSQEKDDFLWIRDDFIYNSNLKEFNTIFIVGHTPTSIINLNSKKQEVVRIENKFFIDCGAVFNGILASIQIIEDNVIAHYYTKEFGYYKKPLGKLR